MPFFLHRLSLFVRTRLRGWRLPLAVALFVFVTSWTAMALLESADSEIARPGTYWWYFVVTSATVGYGDVFPTSTGARVVGLYVIVGGIVTLTLLFTQLANALQSVRGKRLRGVVALELSDHVVLLGYWPGRTERIVAELTAVRACCTQARVITSSRVRSPRTKCTDGWSGIGFSATSSQAHRATWNRPSAVSSATIRSVRPGQ